MLEIPETPQSVISWCNQHPKCRRCPFVGNQCVAPDSDSKYAQWHKKMVEMIEDVAKQTD